MPPPKVEIPVTDIVTRERRTSDTGLDSNGRRKSDAGTEETRERRVSDGSNKKPSADKETPGTQQSASSSQPTVSMDASFYAAVEKAVGTKTDTSVDDFWGEGTFKPKDSGLIEEVRRETSQLFQGA